jgi:hypothetical protein
MPTLTYWLIAVLFYQLIICFIDTFNVVINSSKADTDEEVA